MSALLQPYSEAEHVVLAAYLGVAPRIATALDCAAALSRLYPKGTGVDAPSPGAPGPRPIDVAVARIALGQAQQELPQCGGAVGDALLLMRRAWPSARPAIVRPQHLLGIN